jgi:hypothetical protein
MNDTQHQSANLLYGTAAIAGYLGLSERAASHRIAAGQIPTFKIGGTVSARKETLTAWLKEEEARAADDARKVAISQLCTLAGCPQLAEHYAASGMSARELTSHLVRERESVGGR